MCRSRARMILTLIGISGSIAMFISLTSISSDLKYQLDHTVANSNIDVIVLEKGSSTPVSSRIEIDSVKSLAKVEKVKSVLPMIIGSVSTEGAPYLLLFGFPAGESDLPILKWLGTGLIDGKMFKTGGNEIIIGRQVANKLKKEVGDIITLRGKHEYIVTGIFWVGQGLLDGGVIIDVNNSLNLMKRKGFVNMALVEGYHKNEIAELIRSIQKKFPAMKAIPASSFRNQLRAVLMIDSFVTAVSTTALFLSCLLILNTFLMAVSERTREIGILMAIGWSRLMIIRLIITEALLIGFMGGVFGYVLAFPLLYIIKSVPATMGPGWVPIVPDGGQFLIGILMACGIAVLSALYPAIFSTKLLPVNALRYE